MIALRCADLDAGHGVPVVRGLDLEVDAGRVLALLGPNGAGKTTVLLTLAGLLPAMSGRIEVGGRPHPGPVAARRGVVLVPDDRALFDSLTVSEHLRLAARSPGREDEALDLFPLLRSRWRVPAGVLSGGEQQMLALARAMVQEPRVLLVDEMSMGLAPAVAQVLVPTIRAIADGGVGVVLVEQHVHLALAVADHAIVLAHGEVALAAPAGELAEDPDRLRAAYLGPTHTQPT